MAGQRLGVLAVSTALAGPLLYLSGQDGGGIHIRGSSSTGKTSLARAAASVWGPRTYMRSWRATANWLEGAAVLATDTSLVLDELGVIDSRELNAAVYQLAIGHGSGRARRYGFMRTPASWRVMVVSTGEISIASKVEVDRNRRARAGQEVRILDIPADAGRGHGAFHAPRDGEDSAAALADEIVRSAEQFYWGWLARCSCRPSSTMASTRPPTSSMRRSRPSARTRLILAPMVRSDELRVPVVLIAAAGELAHDLGIVPNWQGGEAIKAAEFALEKWIAGRGGNEAAEVIQAIRAVGCSSRSIAMGFEDAEFGEGRFPIVPVGAGAKSRISCGWSCRRGGGRKFVPALIRPHVARVLADRGMCCVPTNGTSAHTASTAGC